MASLYDHDEKTYHRYVVGCPRPHPVERLRRMDRTRYSLPSHTSEWDMPMDARPAAARRFSRAETCGMQLRDS